jgi:hypothetical protein
LASKTLSVGDSRPAVTTKSGCASDIPAGITPPSDNRLRKNYQTFIDEETYPDRYDSRRHRAVDHT